MSDIFCKIIAGEVSADIVYRDDDFIVIKDLHPKAPVHLLVIPAAHVDSIGEASPEILGKAMALAHTMAQKAGLEGKGYRLIVNDGPEGGKIVPHLHIHVLGGKPLGPKIVQE